MPYFLEKGGEFMTKKYMLAPEVRKALKRSRINRFNKNDTATILAGFDQCRQANPTVNSLRRSNGFGSFVARSCCTSGP